MSAQIECDVAIVGAGPAGLNAALAATEFGAAVVVLDEYPEPGGQFLKQLPADFRVRDHEQLGRDYTKGDALFARVRKAGIRIINEALVWGAFEPGALSVSCRGDQFTVKARAIVVATGAYERPAVFPGWDLPGVMTPGAAQTLVKNQRTLPGNRIVLAGSGPFLLPVASTLLGAGASIGALLEATHPSAWWRDGARGLAHVARMREAVGYAFMLAVSRVPVRFRRIVVRAEGNGRLERVVTAACDEAGRAIPGTRVSEPCDVLCASYGFIPAVQVTRLLGCRHRYDLLRGGWIPEYDDDMETSVPGVFVAGEVAGIGGAHAAMAEGEIAGLAAAVKTGCIVPLSRYQKAEAVRTHHRSFAAIMNRVFAPKADLDDHITDETIVCRCEEVTAGEIRGSAHEWSPNVNTVKGVTRCGMGLCQGRICGSVVEQLVARKLGREPGTVDTLRSRLPVRPVVLGDIAKMEDG